MLIQAKKPPIDVMFFLYQRRQQLRDAEANSSAMSILSRVRFEELKALGDELCLRVKHSQVPILTCIVCIVDRLLNVTFKASARYKPCCKAVDILLL
jgi:hypothetical protein